MLKTRSTSGLIIPLFASFALRTESRGLKLIGTPASSIHGSIDNTGGLVNIEEDTANVATYCKFMDEIVKHYPEYHVFMMFVDRASYHRAKLVREHIYQLRRQGKNFKLIWLPRYSPEMNPIEQLWKPFGRNVHSKVINAKHKLISVVKQELNLVSPSAKAFWLNISH